MRAWSGVISVLAGALLAGACGPSGGDGTNNNNEPVECGFWETECDGECVSTGSDPNHCGRCNNPCLPGEVCDGTGNCRNTCPAELVNCGGSCVDVNHSVDHCGWCDQPCDTGEICVEGHCQDDSCTTSSSDAQTGLLPADIIVVVDNSGSMTKEAQFVQDSMNDFASIIGQSGIDYHVILISDDSTDENGICVPQVLGSGACPNDENLPSFRHVVQSVASTNALELILSTYPQWSSSLRPNATKTITVITDDNSSLPASTFMTDLVALDPTFQGVKFDAIYAPTEPGVGCALCAFSGTPCAQCDPCCGYDDFLNTMCVELTASVGTVYAELVQLTGGVAGDLCTQDFLPTFQDMATAVINDSKVACVYDIPDPGGGEQIDYTKVNIEFITTPGATPQVLFNVPGGEADCGPGGGWYYDNATAPTQIIFCPATCDLVEASSDGSVSVKFGCETVIG